MSTTYNNDDQMDNHQKYTESASGDPYAEVPLPKGDSKAIRLLEILRGTSKDSTGIIACTMRLGTMDETYHALSYTWGSDSETDQKTITLNGVSIPVRRNLWDFLKQELRKEAQERKKKLLWIDALCIQQVDTPEKNHQVALMGQIYSNAACVLIWLGADVGSLQVSEIGNKEIHRSVDLPVEVHSKIRHHAYWRRAWILQECVLAKEVQILGGNFVASEHFLNALKEMSTPLDPFGKVWKVRQKWHGTATRDYAALVEYDHRKPECCEPRDRIYSRLAIMDPSHNIVADYNKSTEDLCVELTHSCISWDKYRIHNIRALGYMLDLNYRDQPMIGIIQEAHRWQKSIITEERVLAERTEQPDTESFGSGD